MDLVGHVDLVGLVRVRCRLSGRLVAFLEFCSQFVRISAARCVCVLSDGGCHGGSLVDLGGQVDLVGYVRVPCRL